MHRRRTMALLLMLATTLAAHALPAADTPPTEPTTQRSIRPALLTAPQILALPPAKARPELLRLLAASRQSLAEHITADLVEKYPRDLQLQFLHAVLTRSRFDIPGAAPLFEHVSTLHPTSVEGRCASLMLLIDCRKDPTGSFSQLAGIARKEAHDPVVTWLAAIACRTLHRNIEGIDFYRALFNEWDPGPVLAHQTFANLLGEENLLEESLIHRRMAVKLEPAGWSYQGLAITLADLNRREEANAAYEKAAVLQPRYLLTWWTWASDLYKWGEYQSSIDKAREAVRLDPRCDRALNVWGLDLEALGKPNEAIAKFELSIQADPSNPYPYNNIARILEARGDTVRAEGYRRKARLVKAGVP